MSMEETIRKIVQEEMQGLLGEIRELLDTRDLKPTPKYVRVAQAAKLLNVSVSTMYEMTRKEGFPVIRKGTNQTVVIDFEEMQKWLKTDQKIS